MYEDSQSGKNLYQEFLERGFEHNLCVSKAIQLNAGASVSTYRDVLTSLGSVSSFTVTVFLGSSSNALTMLEAANLVRIYIYLF